MEAIYLIFKWCGGLHRAPGNLTNKVYDYPDNCHNTF